MIRFGAFAIYAAAILAMSASGIDLRAQASAQTARSPSIAVYIAFPRDHVPVGEKPMLDVTVKNIGDGNLCVSADDYRVHLEGMSGEPPKTELYRHMLGDFHPGDGPALSSGPVACQPIAPGIEGMDGTSATFHFDLTRYYDLSVPGEYSVYLEAPDKTRDTWLWVRTNTARLELLAGTK